MKDKLFIQEKKETMTKGAIPTNKKLYHQVVTDAKKRFKVWPSAYASGWVVHQYKERGGTYKTSKNNTTTLDRWFKEEWVNVCEFPKIVPCGRSKASMKDYPYCRPLKRITKETPKTAGQLTSIEIVKRCKKKKQNPTKRIVEKRTQD